MNRYRILALTAPLLAASCAGLQPDSPGALQPQAIQGSCTVKKFYLLNLTAVHTDMAVRNDGLPCSFTILNPNLQIVTTAALVTEPAAHGQAGASTGGYGVRQALASYTPQRGYAGPDHFTVTLEPNDRAISVAVTVQPAAP